MANRSFEAQDFEDHYEDTVITEGDVDPDYEPSEDGTIILNNS
jgi:hypothetical protein